MRVAAITAFDRPLSVQERPVPEPGEGRVLVRIEASGLCHTDIHAARGDWPVKPALPRVPGHEGVGVVEALGAGVSQLEVGRRVALPWLGSACGTCRECLTGWETLCAHQQNTGYSIDGAHAEFAVADARFAVPVPDGIDPVEAAPLTCAGVTTYKAVRVAGVRPAETVAVFGLGGLGHLAQQYAQIAGAGTVAVDVVEDKLAMARELGARAVVDASRQDPAAAIRALGGADAAIVTAADPRVALQAHASLRPGGRLVLVGLPKDGTVPLPVFETVLRGISVTGSIVGTRADLADVFRLHAEGRTHVVVEERKLEEINDCIEDVLAGRVRARVVLSTAG